MSYAISLAAGLVVGLLYYFARVQSPAPPLVALVGLLGIVIGEHAIPVVQAQFEAPSARAGNAASPGSAGSPSTPKRADETPHQ